MVKPLVIHFLTCNGDNRVNCFYGTTLNVSSIKYLEVIFEQYLRCDIQIYYVCNVVRKFFYNFKVLKYIFNNNCLRLIYIALVQSILSYGLEVWGNSSDNNG